MAIFEHYAIKDYEIKIYNLVQSVLFARDTILYKNVEQGFEISHRFFSKCTFYRLQHFIFSTNGYFFELIFASLTGFMKVLTSII